MLAHSPPLTLSICHHDRAFLAESVVSSRVAQHSYEAKKAAMLKAANDEISESRACGLLRRNVPQDDANSSLGDHAWSSHPPQFQIFRLMSTRSRLFLCAAADPSRERSESQVGVFGFVHYFSFDDRCLDPQFGQLLQGGGVQVFRPHNHIRSLPWFD